MLRALTTLTLSLFLSLSVSLSLSPSLCSLTECRESGALNLLAAAAAATAAGSYAITDGARRTHGRNQEGNTGGEQQPQLPRESKTGRAPKPNRIGFVFNRIAHLQKHT